MYHKNQYIIQKMTSRHISRVLEIERESYHTPWSETAFKNQIMSNYSLAIVAMSKGTVVGYLVAWIVVDQVHIANIAVDLGYRRCGIGTQLMKWLISEAIQENCISSTLEVRKSNQAALIMYKQLGYRSIATRKLFYSNPEEDALVMIKTL